MTVFRQLPLRCSRCNRSVGDAHVIPRVCPFCGGKLVRK